MGITMTSKSHMTNEMQPSLGAMPSRARRRSKLARLRPPTTTCSGRDSSRARLSSQRTVEPPTRPLPPTTSARQGAAAAAAASASRDRSAGILRHGRVLLSAVRPRAGVSAAPGAPRVSARSNLDPAPASVALAHFAPHAQQSITLKFRMAGVSNFESRWQQGMAEKGHRRQGTRLLLAALLAGVSAEPRIFRWGEQPSGEGDYVWFSAHLLQGKSVAIAGLSHGSAEISWPAARLWPRCAFPNGAGGYTPYVRATLVGDPESRVANPKIAVFKAIILYCDAPPGAALAPAGPAYVRLALGEAEARIPYEQPTQAPTGQVSICSRVFGSTIHTRFVTEWFAHHRRNGVDRFILHDHGDPEGKWGSQRPDLAQVLESQPADSVQVVPMIGPYRTWAFHQKLAYYDCLLRSHTASWVMFLDIDEAVWVRGRSLGELLARLPAYTTALVLQFAEVLTFACRSDREVPLLQRMTYVRTPAPTRMPRKNCVGGKYAVRPLFHIRTQLNTHAPKNRTRPFCVMPDLASGRVHHYHQD
ncbi:hypothetical protein T492DRAFT_326271 [Pavlovales sp. CCMP2436]|nr:hypothetical protein T492DRAFT_326271 [Pavlovales sp. CCMP2436]